jgi:hypothetical protein
VQRGKFAVLVCLHRLHMIQIYFVSYERHMWRLTAFERFHYKFVPVFQILKRLLVGDVIGEDDSVGLIDVGADHFAED